MKHQQFISDNGMSLCSICLMVCVIFSFTQLTLAQTTRDLNSFPDLINANIPGAPKLDQPILISGSDKAILSEGFGLAAPAWWDWDKDGVKDLLIGEFGSGVEFREITGNFIRVYQNVGTTDKPAFTGRFNYARAPFEILTTGTPYSVDQGCCIGFTPQFIDLDKDGQMDLITGTYYGEISWLKGSEVGFLPAQALPQEGEPRGKDHIKEQDYWLFSSASAGDLTGDGLPDLVLGGTSIRISKNVGTPEIPKFGHRELLLDVAGNPLKVYEHTEQDKKEFKIYADTFGWTLPVGGDEKISPYVVDWDNDGILDLLITNAYTHEGLSAVDFFKGIKVNGQHRFQKPVALFKSKDGAKAVPGSGPRIFVADYNNDGVNDLLVGASVVTTNGKFNERLSWNWEKKEGIQSAGKDPGYVHEENEAQAKARMERYKGKLPAGISLDEYITIRHQGHIYVMLGQKQSSVPAKAEKSKMKAGK